MHSPKTNVSLNSRGALPKKIPEIKKKGQQLVCSSLIPSLNLPRQEFSSSSSFSGLKKKKSKFGYWEQNLV